MSIYNRYNLKIRKSFLSILIQLSEANKKYHVNEIDFIKRVGLKLGLTLEEIKTIQRNPEKDPQLPHSVNDRLLFFYHMIHILKTDGKIEHKEIELLKSIAFKYYLNPSLVDDLIYLSNKYHGGMIPEEELIAQTNKYLN